MSALLNLLGGSGLNFAVIGGAIVAILGFMGTLLYKAKKSGIDQQKAKEAVSRDQELDRIKRAAGARPVGGVSDDPNNRDIKNP